MTTKVAATLDFAAPVATVWTLLSDPGYLDYKRAHVGSFDLKTAQNGDHTQLTFTRPISAELPGPAAAILGSQAHIVETQDWSAAAADGSRSAELSIVVGQAPAKIFGTATLSPTATGTHITIELSISVSIPLFGGTAEQMIKSELEKYIDAEQRLGAEWLAQK